MAIEITLGMFRDAARARNNGESWAAIGRQWGVSGATAKAMYLYLRASREFVGATDENRI
jgi:hypothetical protein